MTEPVPAVPSATVLLLRQREAVEVLMVTRGRGAPYDSALVFPGGKVDASDHGDDWRALIDEPIDDPLERALRIAGLREVYEETGLLPFDHPDGPAAPGRDTPFVDLVRRAGGQLPIGDMQLLARWITARSAPKRFDTYFYLCPLDGDEAQCDGFETVGAEWITPARALAMGDAGERRLLFPTRSQLRRIDGFTTIGALLAHNAAIPVTPIETEVVTRDGEAWVVIPQGAGYDIYEEKLPQAAGRP